MKIQTAIASFPWVSGVVVAIVVFGMGRTRIETIPCLVAARDFGRESLQVSVTTPADPTNPESSEAAEARSKPIRGFQVVHLQIPNDAMRRAVVRSDRCAHLIGTKLSRYVKKGEVLLHDHVDLRPPSQGPSYEVFTVKLDTASNAKSLIVEKLRIGRPITFVQDTDGRKIVRKILDFEVRADNKDKKVLVNLILALQADGTLSDEDREFVDAVRGAKREAFIDAYLD
jgi:hypothetical protein